MKTKNEIQTKTDIEIVETNDILLSDTREIVIYEDNINNKSETIEGINSINNKVVTSKNKIKVYKAIKEEAIKGIKQEKKVITTNLRELVSKYILILNDYKSKNEDYTKAQLNSLAMDRMLKDGDYEIEIFNAIKAINKCFLHKCEINFSELDYSIFTYGMNILAVGKRYKSNKQLIDEVTKHKLEKTILQQSNSLKQNKEKLELLK